MTPTDNPFPSHFEYPGRLAGAPGALIFFCLLFFHQGKKRRSENRQVTLPIRGTYKGAYAFAPYPAGRKKNLCLSGLPRPIHFKKTYTSHQPIPVKKINRRPSGLPIPIHFKKTYTSHQPIPIKKINRRPSGLPIPIHFKKTYAAHQPIPIKKINQCPSGLPLPSHFEYPERLAGAPGALIFFYLLFFHQGKKRRSEDRQVTLPIRSTYKRAYAFAPYPAGRKKNQRLSGLLFPIHFKKTYATHQPIPIKKINQCPSGLPLSIHFKKTYTSHQPIPIKKINQRPSGLPLPIHFSNIVHHTLCFSFK